MDTYVHIAVGAAVGDAVAHLIDQRALRTNLIDSPQPLRSRAEYARFGLVAGSGLVAGLASHLLTDALPHSDILVNHGLLIPNTLWPLREFLVCVLTLILLASRTRGRRRWLVLAAGLMGGIPDLESLGLGVGILSREMALFPTHNGSIPHGRNLGALSLIIEMGSLLLALFWFFRKKKPSGKQPGNQF